MTGKSNIELLMANPEAMRRFQDALEQAATFVGINKEIDKISDALRTQLLAGFVCELDSSELLNFYRNEEHERLMVFATAVGTELGKRWGRERGSEVISEARIFSEMHVTNIGASKTGSET